MLFLFKTISRVAAPLAVPVLAFCDEEAVIVSPAAIAEPQAWKPRTADVPETHNLSLPDDDLEWEEKKRNCSFCRHFLESPCKLQFKNWSKCVEKCKEKDTDFVEICSSHTRDLVTCTSSNPDYFNEPGDNDDSDATVSLVGEEAQNLPTDNK